MKLVLKIVLAVIIFYFFFETAFYFLDMPKEYHPHNFPLQVLRVKDINFLYVNKPSSSIDFIYDGNPRGYFHADNVVQHVTNGYGFRGPLFSFTKPAGTTRVLFFGDSLTFGEGVYLEDTYPEQFAKKTGFEAINLGVSGYNTIQEAALLKSFQGKLHEDAIVLGYFLNDAEPYLFSPSSSSSAGMIRRTSELEEEAAVLNKDFSTPWFVKFSRTIRILWQYSLKRKLNKLSMNYYEALYRKDNPNWQRTQQALADFAAYSQRQKVPVVVVIFPILYNVGHNYPLQNILDLLHSELDVLRLSYVDLMPELKKYRDSDLWVHPTDQHPNEIVHRITAELLVKKFSVILKP